MSEKDRDMSDISRSAPWGVLESLAKTLSGASVAALFAGDPARAERFSVEAAGLYLDYAKNKITPEVFAALQDLAAEADLAGAIKRMVSGEKINTTEARAVLHVALRDFAMRTYHVGGEDVSLLIRAEREKVEAFVGRVHSGAWKGRTGKPIDTFVNIGIGGSDLGPQMAVEALRPYWIDGKRTFFVSNIDGQQLTDTLAAVNPETTLFMIASKTFTTQETMTNARSAKDWFLEQGGDDATIASHFVALSTNERAVVEFGVDPKNMFRFWDWVGGRFSLWSSIGLPIALQTGFETYEKLLRGAHAMDEHFRAAPLNENMPALLALIGVWNRNFQDIGAHAVLPYDQHLHRLPAYLQQADMESNGKSVTADGARVLHKTAPVIFGEPGTNGQHAFYQLIHQGTDVISADFIAPALSQSPLGDHHEKLLANFLAQPEALMQGKSEEVVRKELTEAAYSAPEIDRLAPHKVFPGDRPTNMIVMERLTPETLGALIALYEHKIFCQGVIWGVNSFDQWGVELGKELARQVLPEIAAIGEDKPAATTHDPSTNRLIDRINKIRRNAK